MKKNTALKMSPKTPPKPRDTTGEYDFTIHKRYVATKHKSNDFKSDFIKGALEHSRKG